VRANPGANAGDIVVALIGGEDATLKRFYLKARQDSPAAGKLRNGPIMVARTTSNSGRVIGVLRKY